MMNICVLVVLLGVANGALLGAKKCTWGPSYWCENFQQADECGAMDHCRKNVWSKQTKPSVIDDSSACTFCKDIVSDVRNYLDSNATEATVLQYMNRACDFLPDEYSQQECKKIEQHYMDQFKKCIQDNMDPDSICKLVRLCQSGSSRTQPRNDLVQAQSVQPAQFARVSLKSAALGVRVHDESVKLRDEPLCDACKSYITLTKKEVTDTTVQDAIKARIMVECDKMSGLKKIECEAVVNEALPQVFSFIAGELTDQLCVSAGLCTSYTTSPAAATAAIKERLSTAIRSDAVQGAIRSVATRFRSSECDTCEEIAGYAKIFLSNHAIEQELQQALTTDVCPQLGEFADMCKTLVEEYLPQIYDDLLKRLDPATICTDLRLCSAAITTKAPVMSSTSPASSEESRVKARTSIQCVVCEFAINKLDSILSKNATEEQIVAAVEKVCSLLPSTVRTECDSVVEKYGPAIINLLVHGASPSTVCSFLGLCAAGDSMYKLPLPKDSELCSLCETTLSYLDTLLEENSTKEEIVQAVEKVCHYLGGELASQCNSMVEQYGPAIIDLLASHMKPQPLCTNLGLCQSNKPVKADGLVHLYKSTGNY